MHRTSATELAILAESLRDRIAAIDVAAAGVADGMRHNTVCPDGTAYLLDMIAEDLRRRADAIVVIALAICAALDETTPQKKPQLVT